MTTQRFDNLDDGESIFFARELEHKKAQSYDVVRAPLKAFELIPVSSEAGTGAETITYTQYDMTGIAKIIANYADDLPRVSVKGKEFTSRVRSIGNHYGYSLQEIRAAQFAGKPLTARMANAAVRAHREAWNRIAFNGDAEHGILGWISNPNIPANAVANDGAGSTTTWSTKTNAQILRDMNDLANGIVDDTNGAEIPDTLVLPIAQYTKIASTRMDSGTDTTILTFFLQSNPFIKSVEWANELKGAGPLGVDIMIAYRRDPEAMTLEMPQMFEQLAVQQKGLEFQVPCHSRIGGVLVYYPFSQAIGEGI